MQRSPAVPLVLIALCLACVQAQTPRFSFATTNYHPPADEAAVAQSPDYDEGGSPPVTGSSLDTTLFHFAGAPLQQFNDTILKGNQGCSPHSPADYMSISSMVVPTLEATNPAIRTWRQTDEGGPTSLPTSVIYMDLPSGLLITGGPQFNWTQQLNYMNYTVLSPNVVDLADYRRTLSQLVNITQGLVTGQPPWTSPGAPCNRPIPALNGTLAYLKAAQAQLVNATAVGNGLRPFEVRLPSGCIQETDANYRGDLVSGVLNNTMDGDRCCQLCRSSKGCNVWVWCPLTSGCQTGSGSFPYLGCQLKHQAYVSTSAAPQPLPSAWSRGPPTAFVSGRLAYT
ncbi:hypothetical protein CVIRNUC_010158 [Coccomyxa viridis]|uniref:Apple domain-containing protein n=1 Tax=Coccomyxa viridis TaxID=1274662 RepID=A0AAV1IHY5_9CHLO|nr:hypothetical protein CVIRNUC_010158 [Coccomyxa viridis]